MRLRDPLLLLVVFTAGATVMSTEMGATRLLAPYFGTSTLIWANLIGLILIYLTLGYSLGGRLADRHPYASGLYQLTAWAGFTIVLVPILAEPLLRWSIQGFARLSAGIFFGSLFSILMLFSVPVVLLGAVSPYAIRLRLNSLSHAGNTAGSLYALSTVGSILGTFVPVLLLQPTIGTRASIWAFGLGLLTISLVGLALQVRRRVALYAAMLAVAVLLVIVFHGGNIRPAYAGKVLYEGESTYNYIQVVRDGGWTELMLNEGHAIHSVYNPDKLLTGGPWDYFLLAPLFRPEGIAKPVKDVLVIGLAGGTVARDYSQVYPKAHIDGVEIDGRIVALGRKYFSMDEPQLHTIVQDGRYYLLTTDKKYDVIMIDAYRQPYIPFHLATTEFFQLVRQHLNPGGVVVINAGRTESDYRLVDAMGITMGAVFPSVFVIDTDSGFTNSLVYATDKPMTLAGFRENLHQVQNPTLSTVAGWAVDAIDTGHGGVFKPRSDLALKPFTDDLAPIERVIDQIIINYAVGEIRQ